MQASAGDITIDCRTGAIAGATTVERLALQSLRLAARALEPFHRFGLSRIVRAVGYLVGSSKGMVFQLGENSRMRTPFCDPYWTALIVPNTLAGLSVTKIVEAFRDVDFGFIDGGANYGCWSILVSGWQPGAKPVLAIEAASDTFERLSENCALNGGRFAVLNRAISGKSGERVLIYGDRHEARSIVAPGEGAKPVLDCVTIALDDLMAEKALSGARRYLVKLDIEGMEAAAMAAAEGLLEADSAFIYEDHGADRTHAITRKVLGDLGLRVFWIGEGREEACEITNVRQLDRIKRSKRYGYDLVATRSPFWLERLSALMTRNAASAPAKDDEPAELRVRAKGGFARARAAMGSAVGPTGNTFLPSYDNPANSIG
jgi:FkbM family methyltransferase